MKIVIDDLRGPEIRDLLLQHLRSMTLHSPPASIHALDLEALRQPDITFWTALDAADLLGCAALKALTPEHAELKSMRTAAAHLRKGVARRLLQHILDVARQRGFVRISLETGTAPAFAAAQALYLDSGFQYSPPFGDYVVDPYSTFMTREL
ncbi:MAG: GNAT family N-acetyltransferase [Casimicrobiaceae bacterium]